MPAGSTPPYPWKQLAVDLFNALDSVVRSGDQAPAREVLDKNREVIEKASAELAESEDQTVK